MDVRKNQKHKSWVNWRWFRVYYSGSYAWLAIDFGRIGHHELSLYFFNTDCRFRKVWRKPL